MINQVIKTKAQAKKVANAMKKDINEMLSIYESYSVRMEDDDDRFCVYVTSPNSCPILTSAAVGDVMNVLKAYDLQYRGINYHIDTEKWNGEYIPVFVICVAWDDKEEQ